MSVFRLIRRQAFALAIILCAASAYLWPGLYIEWFGVKLAPFVGPSIQLIMFGMGTTLTAADFLCVAKTRGAWPWGASVDGDAEVGGRRELRAGNGELDNSLAGVRGEPEERAAVFRDKLRRALPLAPAGEVVVDAARQHAAARAYCGMVDGREALREVNVKDRLGRQREAGCYEDWKQLIFHGTIIA